MRTCTRCGETKPDSEYWKPSAKCKPCQLAYNRERAKPRPARKYSEDYKQRRKEKAFIRRYGITREQRDEMFVAQGLCCAICKSTESNGPDWCTDHDHSCCDQKSQSCGSCVRGVLCFRCNTLLGHAKDNIETLYAAIEYLKNWRVTGAA